MIFCDFFLQNTSFLGFFYLTTFRKIYHYRVNNSVKFNRILINLCYNKVMADYIFIRKSRNALSSLLHMILNLLLAVVSIGATVITGNCIIGLILIVASKWRIFAVNHRYWWLNIRSSLVDLIVGISCVLLAYAAGASFLPVHFALMVFYAFWLIVIKPRSSLTFAMVQALVAVFIGSTAATVFAAITDSAVLVVAELIIGYAASHHVLIQGNDHDSSFISIVCGLVFAEIAWLSHAWLIIYSFGTTGICVSQISIILTLLAFAYFKIYSNLSKHEGKLQLREIALPLTFSIVVVAVLIIGFSQPMFNIH